MFECHAAPSGNVAARSSNDPNPHEEDINLGQRDKYRLIGADFDQHQKPSFSRSFRHLDEHRPVTRFLEDFPGEVVRAHVSVLRHNSHGSIHRDGLSLDGKKRGGGFELFNTTLRFHVPLITNKNSWIYVDWQFNSMDPGRLWLLDNLVPHAVINRGTEDRLHFIFDVAPNEDTLSMVERAKPGSGAVNRELEAIIRG